MLTYNTETGKLGHRFW